MADTRPYRHLSTLHPCPRSPSPLPSPPSRAPPVSSFLHPVDVSGSSITTHTTPFQREPPRSILHHQILKTNVFARECLHKIYACVSSYMLCFSLRCISLFHVFTSRPPETLYARRAPRCAASHLARRSLLELQHTYAHTAAVRRTLTTLPILPPRIRPRVSALISPPLPPPLPPPRPPTTAAVVPRFLSVHIKLTLRLPAAALEGVK